MPYLLLSVASTGHDVCYMQLDRAWCRALTVLFQLQEDPTEYIKPLAVQVVSKLGISSPGGWVAVPCLSTWRCLGDLLIKLAKLLFQLADLVL